MAKKDSVQQLETYRRFAEFEQLNPDWADQIKCMGGFGNVDVNSMIVTKSGQERSISDCNSCLVGEGRSDG